MKQKVRWVASWFVAVFLGVVLTIGAGAYRLSQAAPAYAAESAASWRFILL